MAQRPEQILDQALHAHPDTQFDIGSVDLSRFDPAPLMAFTATKKAEYGTKRPDELRQDAVRIALTSGPAHLQVADDLGMSASIKLGNSHQGSDVVSKQDLSPAQENERLWPESRVLRRGKRYPRLVSGKGNALSNGRWPKRALGAA